MESDLTPDALQILDPDAQRLTREMLSAVACHPNIRVNRFTLTRRRYGDGFEYFLGLHKAGTPTPFRQHQVLQYNMVSQLQYLGFVEAARGEHVPRTGWYQFTDKALEWFQRYGVPGTNRSEVSELSNSAAPRKYDVFISHASEDKDELVRPLANALQSLGLRVWYDEFTLRIGSSLRKSIDRGLRDSRFGVIILSPSFIKKNWTQYELDGLIAKVMTTGEEGTILPIWHHITKAELMAYSPSLTDIIAGNTATSSIEDLAAEIVETVHLADD